MNPQSGCETQSPPIYYITIPSLGFFFFFSVKWKVWITHSHQFLSSRSDVLWFCGSGCAWDMAFPLLVAYRQNAQSILMHVREWKYKRYWGYQSRVIKEFMFENPVSNHLQAGQRQTQAYIRSGKLPFLCEDYRLQRLWVPQP